MKRRMLCVLLALVLCAGLLPAAGLAAEAPAATELPVTDSSETAPEGTTPPEGTDASDNTDGATDADTSDDTDTSDTTDDTDTSDDTDVSDDDTDTSGDVDTADDTDSDDASDAVQSVATTASLSDGEGTATTATSITLDVEVTVSAAPQTYTITLDPGVYTVEGTVGSISLQSKQEADASASTPGGSGGGPGGPGPGGQTETVAVGSLLVVNKSAAETYTVTCSVDGTFKIISASNSHLVPTLTPGTSPAETEKCYKCYRFTATEAGTYLLTRPDSQQVTTVRGNLNKLQSYIGTIVLTLNAQETVYFELGGSGTSGSICLYAYKSLQELKTTDTAATSVSDNSLLRAKPAAGWLVLESGAADVRALGEGTSVESFDLGGKKYIYSDGRDLLFTARGSGSLRLRAMTDGDSTAMTAGTDYNGAEFYRFEAATAGDYTVTATDADLYLNGRKLAKNVVSLAAGDVLYVRNRGTSCKIEATTVPSLVIGETFAVESGEKQCRRFTSPTNATYCFYADGVLNDLSAVDHATGSVVYNGVYGWLNTLENQLSSGYRLIEMEAGQTIDFYFAVNSAESSRTVNVTFNTLEGMFPAVELGREYTAEREYCGYRFVPTTTGLYIIQVNEKPEGGRGSELQPIGDMGTELNGTEAVELDAGQTYIIFTREKDAPMKVQAAETFGFTEIVLNTPAESSESTAFYKFTPSKSGFYEIELNGCEGSVYDSTGLQSLNNSSGIGPSHQQPGGVQTCTVVLNEGETVYLIAKRQERGGPGESQNQNQSMSLTVREKSLDDAQRLELNREYKGANALSGDCVFEAETAGMYVLTGGNATVLAENNGNKKTISPALFRLEAGQKAYITFTKGDGTIAHKIVKVQDYETKELALNANTTYEDSGALYRFTAPADGLYMFSLPETGNISWLYLCDMNMRQRTMFMGADVAFRRSFICDMKQGESVYLIPSLVNRNPGAATGGPLPPGMQTDEAVNGTQTVPPAEFRVQAVTVSEALTEIGTYIGTTDADTREAVQELGTDNLTEAMTGSEANEVVDKMGALENAVTDSAVTTDVASESISPRVNVVGAKLNTLTKETVTLRVEDGTERTLPADVDWSEEDAIHLTMDLDGVADTSSLAVPVCITLAVPEGMDPEKVRLVHYGAERTEVLEPIVVYEAEDGVWYARFVVGGFSPFALAELAANDAGGNAGDNAGGNAGGGTQKGRSPKTGDESRLLLWAAVLLLACGGAVLVLKKKHN